jgi:predicted RNA-binding protein associated with RNAse of E/G family
VSRPARLQDGDVYWEDLGLDIVVLPDGTIHVLDQDEFERLDLTEPDRATALSSLEEVRHLAQGRVGPFAMPM